MATINITLHKKTEGPVTAEYEGMLHRLFEPIAESEGLKCDIEVLQPSFTYKIEQDRSPFSPRENMDPQCYLYENAIRGRNHYASPDNDAYSPWNEVEGKVIDGKFFTEDEKDEGQIGDGIEDDDEYDDEYEYEAIWDNAEYETRYRLDDNVDLCFEYTRHQDGSIFCGDKAMPREIDEDDYRDADGFAFVTRERLIIMQLSTSVPSKEELDEALVRAESCVRAEIEEYAHYAVGNVWGFVIEDEEDEEVESCWGFYGEDWDDVKHMLEHVDEEHRAGLTEAWNRRFN